MKTKTTMTDSVEPVDGIQRWGVNQSPDDADMEPRDDGYWCRYLDHVTELERVRNETHQQLLATIERLRVERCVSHNYGVALDDLIAALLTQEGQQ